MQAARQTPFAAATAKTKPQAGNGPQPIAPELLQLIGGGKAAPAPTTNAQLPVGKW